MTISMNNTSKEIDISGNASGDISAVIAYNDADDFSGYKISVDAKDAMAINLAFTEAGLAVYGDNLNEAKISVTDDSGEIVNVDLDSKSDTVLLTIDENGELDVEEPLETPPQPDEPKPVNNPFTDVAEKDYYFEPVMWAVENGITSGLSATEFGPSAGCTRAQVVTFLWRAAGEPAPKSSTNPFKDVKEGVYYYNAVLWAVENGITTGLSADTFGPNVNCNRGQIVTFLWRAKGKPAPTNSDNPFIDVPETQYYYDAVLWAVENGITTGLSADSFGPNSTCTRGQIVTFLYRAYK